MWRRNLVILVLMFFISVIYRLSKSWNFLGKLHSNSERGICSTISHKLSRTSRLHNSTKLFSHRKRVLFVLGQGRTGSTLIGSLFNEYHDVLYFFEPLRALEKHLNVKYFKLNSNREKTVYHSKTTDFLLQAARCSYNEKQDRIFEQFEFGSFRSYSKSLSSPPFCDTLNKNCKKLKSHLLNAFCAIPNTTLVIKDLEFRLPNQDFTFIESLARNLAKEVDVYVIHLVRDPRAYLWSMKKAGWLKASNQTLEMFGTARCQETARNYKAFLNKKNSFLKYRILRFEDFAISPENVTRKMMSFLNMDFTEKIREYIHFKTSSSNNVEDPYSTSPRNIEKISAKWRSKASFKFVNSVQSCCKDVMNLLNYDFLKSEEEMKEKHTNTIKPLHSKLTFN